MNMCKLIFSIQNMSKHFSPTCLFLDFFLSFFVVFFFFEYHKIFSRTANNVDSDQTKAPSDLGMHCPHLQFVRKAGV